MQAGDPQMAFVFAWQEMVAQLMVGNAVYVACPAENDTVTLALAFTVPLLLPWEAAPVPPPVWHIAQPEAEWALCDPAMFGKVVLFGRPLVALVPWQSAHPALAELKFAAFRWQPVQLGAAPGAAG
jgi:hypothetical protein